MTTQYTLIIDDDLAVETFYGAEKLKLRCLELDSFDPPYKYLIFEDAKRLVLKTETKLTLEVYKAEPDFFEDTEPF